MSCIHNIAYAAAATAQAGAIVQQAVVDSAIQAAVALYQRNSSRSISNMQTEIADEQVQLAEQLHAHAAAFWPEQRELVNDAFSIARLENDYVALPAAWGGMVRDTLEDSRQDWLTLSREKLCIAPGLCDDNRWQRNALLVEADMASYAARQGEARVQALNDWRYELQTSILSMGKGQVRDLIDYQRIRGNIGDNMGGMLASGINSAMRTFGYYQNRRLNEGWGAQIRSVLGTRYPDTYATEPYFPRGQVSVGTIEPIRETATPVSKANEIEEGLRIADDMATGRYN